MKTIALLILLSLSMAGCAKNIELNKAILENDRMTKVAYSQAMTACNRDPGCQVGVTALFFGKDQPALVRDETALDWFKAVAPMSSTILEGYKIYKGGSYSGEGKSMYIDKLNMTGSSFDISGMNDTHSWATTEANNNKDYTLGSDTGTVGDTGIASKEPGVDVAYPVSK